MQQESDHLGELAPLHVRKHLKRPERRNVSRRWLASTVLVGAISFLMMGGALYAALDGQEKLTAPAVAYEEQAGENTLAFARKGNHPGLIKKAATKEKSGVMMVSTVTKVGNQNVVKLRPFLKIDAPMAIAPTPEEEYPKFNPLAVFSESGKLELVAKTADLMYGADVEGEVTLNTVDFPLRTKIAKIPRGRRDAEVHQQVWAIAHNLQSGDAYVSSLVFFDNDRFSRDESTFLTSGDVRITAENVSILGKLRENSGAGPRYFDRTVEVRAEATISEILQSEGLEQQEVSELSSVLSNDLGEENFREGDTLQAWFGQEGGDASTINTTLMKLSVYRGPAHLITIARTDDGRLVYAPQPETPQSILEDSNTQQSLARQNMPTVYDGIYRSALSEGLSPELAGQLVKVFAFDVDYRSRLTPTDELEVFISLEDGQSKPTDQSEILYAAISLGDVKRRYYRFRDAVTGRVDYYDETGKSAKKFLLRKPVPTGKFKSGFGMRRHPISRRYKLHGGVDWAAPRGTPILAAGNGVVEKAGWSGGYGKQTVIRHANGYKTSYSHQTAIKKGVTPGARVRQGQVIGYIGSTGYSTGPHLHYEVLVNSNRVDPMRIRLPRGKVLKDAELLAFEAERDRIDTLVTGDEEIELASN